MPAKIIDGKKIADALLAEVKAEVAALARPPCLAIVLVGNDPASEIYVRKKIEACQSAGIESKDIRLPKSSSEKVVIGAVRKLNSDNRVDAILVQVPLPPAINEGRVLSEVVPEKDADGFHPGNFGKLALNCGKIIPCTPLGIMRLLKQSGVSLSGKHAVVVGRSRIVGKPLALLLLNNDCTVTVCHSKTRGLGKITVQADILCVAAGRPRLIKASMVKPGAVVIDAGTSREGGKLVGDVDFLPVSKKASLITPVPGGVGPMTVAALMKNAVLCHRMRGGR